MRFAPTAHTMFSHRPFQGSGVSVYVTVGGHVKYRNLRAITGCICRGVEFDCGGTSVLKTSRVDYDTSPVSSITVPIDSAWEDERITVDIRTFRDDVENESENYRTVTLDLVGAADNTGILGTARLLDYEPRDGGIVRIRFLWSPVASGVQPDTFTAIRTAGPSSPANASVTIDTTDRQVIEIDTPALSDASPYTYKIQASLGAVTRDVLTDISITADATGPVIPTSGTAEAW